MKPSDLEEWNVVDRCPTILNKPEPYKAPIVSLTQTKVPEENKAMTSILKDLLLASYQRGYQPKVIDLSCLKCCSFGNTCPRHTENAEYSIVWILAEGEDIILIDHHIRSFGNLPVFVILKSCKNLNELVPPKRASTFVLKTGTLVDLKGTEKSPVEILASLPKRQENDFTGNGTVILIALVISFFFIGCMFGIIGVQSVQGNNELVLWHSPQKEIPQANFTFTQFRTTISESFVLWIENVWKLVMLQLVPLWSYVTDHLWLGLERFFFGLVAFYDYLIQNLKYLHWTLIGANKLGLNC